LINPAESFEAHLKVGSPPNKVLPYAGHAIQGFFDASALAGPGGERIRLLQRVVDAS